MTESFAGEQAEGAGIQDLRTEDGELYGFVYGGEIYLDDTKLDPEAPVHGYAHLWDESHKKGTSPDFVSLQHGGQNKTADDESHGHGGSRPQQSVE